MAICLPINCLMHGGKCGLEKSVVGQRLSSKPYIFVALPSSEAFNDTENVTRAVVEGGYVFSQKYKPKKIKGKKFNVLLARDERFVGQGICKICQLCWFCEFGITELGTLNPNVMIEIGLLLGFGKKIIYTLHLSYLNIKEVPFDLGNPMLVPYQSMTRLASNLEDKINFILLVMGAKS